MDEVTLVRDTLRSHGRWHGGRLSLVSIFLIALLRARTVNWSEWASVVRRKWSPTNVSTLLSAVRGGRNRHPQTVVALLEIPRLLSLDRTEWRFGKCVFNLVMLGVVHHGVDKTG